MHIALVIAVVFLTLVSIPLVYSGWATVLLGRLKNRLSHVSASSWHYRVVKFFWKGRARNSKACSYYWLKLPTSLGLLAFSCVFGTAFAAVGIVLLVVVYVASFFLGYWPTILVNDNGKYPPPSHIDPKSEQVKWHLTYGYKRLRNGKRVSVAPWEIALVMGGPYLFYQTFIAHHTLGSHIVSIGSVAAIVIGGLLALGSVLFFLANGWKQPLVQRKRQEVQAAWDKACPPLVVKRSDS